MKYNRNLLEISSLADSRFTRSCKGKIAFAWSKLERSFKPLCFHRPILITVCFALLFVSVQAKFVVRQSEIVAWPPRTLGHHGSYTVDSGFSNSAYSHTPVIITILLFPEFSRGQTLINELQLQSFRFLSHSAYNTLGTIWYPGYAYNHYFLPFQTTKHSLLSHIFGKILMKFYITYIITVLGDLLQFMQRPGAPSTV